MSTKEALKYFGPNGGSVINLSSIAGDSPVPNSVIYSATKGAVNSITVGLSKELGEENSSQRNSFRWY